MKIIVLFLFCGLVTHAYADTEINAAGNDGKKHTIKIQGDWLRAEQELANQDYLIAHLKQDTIYVVLPQQQKILEINSSTTDSENSGLNAELRDKGDGPVIAGFKTQQYELFTNKQTCGSSYISEKAAENKDISNMLAAVGRLNFESMIPTGMETLMQGVMKPCAKAGFNKMGQMTEQGLPVKIVDEKGRLAYEVISIDDTVKLDSKLFTMPKGYARTTPQKMMNEAVQEAMKQISPEQQKMIQDMLQQMGEQMQKK